MTSLIHRAKREHDASLFDRLSTLDGSDSGRWKIVKAAFGPGRGSIPALGFSNGSEIIFANDNKSKADLLNNIFISVTDIKNDVNVFTGQIPRTEARLLDIEIRPSDVIEVINSLSVNKAPGPDSVPPFILKKVVGSNAPVLCELFNRSLRDASFLPYGSSQMLCLFLKKGLKSDPIIIVPCQSLVCSARCFRK